VQTRTLYDLTDGAKQWRENLKDDARIRASRRYATWQKPA
jgi:hypothetical protein